MHLDFVLVLLLSLVLFVGFYFLYKKWRRPKLKKRQNYFLEGDDFLPPQMLLNIDGIKYNFFQHGRGPDLLLIHGIGASVYAWRYIVKELGNHFKVTALDLPGFGLSSKSKKIKYDLDAQAERVLKFCHELSLKNIYVVGSSMGGTIALRMTQLDPLLFNKAFLISPSLSPKVAPVDGSLLKYFSSIFTVAINKHIMRQILKRVLFNNKHITDKQIESQILPYKNKKAIYTFLESLKTVRDPRLPGLFKDIPVPYKIIYGKNDLIIPSKQIHTCIEQIQTKNFEILTEAGHHPMEDRPEKVIKGLTDFYKNQD